MDDTEHRPGDDYFGALDFGDEPGHEAGYGGDAVLDFGDESGHDDRDQSILQALDADQPAEQVDTGTRAAIETLSQDTDYAEETPDPDAEVAWQLATVTNPAETVSVTAMMGGQIHRVELSADAASMTGSELADEILAMADLARQRGLSIQHRLLLQSFRVLGANDDEALCDFLENGMDLSSPEQATQAQAEVFATRYASSGRAGEGGVE